MPEVLPKPTPFCFWQVLLNPEHHIFPLPSCFHRRSSGKKTAGRPRAWGHGATHHHLPKCAGRDPYAQRSHTPSTTNFQQLFISPALILWSLFTGSKHRAGSFHLQFSPSFTRTQQTTCREDITTASPALCSHVAEPHPPLNLTVLHQRNQLQSISCTCTRLKARAGQPWVPLANQISEKHLHFHKSQICCHFFFQPLRISSQPGPQKRCLFVCRHGERMDVVFGKYWLSQCFDAKGEWAPLGPSGSGFRWRKESNSCPEQSLDGNSGFQKGALTLWQQSCTRCSNKSQGVNIALANV